MARTKPRDGAEATVEHVDESALAMAQEMLGTESPGDTVNAALNQVVRERLVTEFLGFMRSDAMNGTDELRAEAWR